MMTVAEAKARIRELGEKDAAAAGLFGSPLIRTVALLAGGALLGRMVGRKKEQTPGQTPLHDLLMRGIAAAGPMLLDHLISAMSSSAKGQAPQCAESPATQGASAG